MIPRTLLVALCLSLPLQSRADDIRLIELCYHSVDDSTFWHPQPVASARLDKLLLAPGEPIMARFETNGLQVVTTRFRQPRATVFTLNISSGDPELLREARHTFPGMLPPVAPVHWQPLPGTLTNGVVSVSTAGLGAGTFRVRLAVADGINAVPSGEGQTNDVLYGDCYVVIASSPHSLDVYTEQRRHVYFRSESIPATILLRSTATLPAGRASVRLVRNSGFSLSGSVSLPAVKADNRRIPFSVETRDLAPGPYTLAIEHAGLTALWLVEIVDPISPSVITISENQMISPFADAILGCAFGWPGPDALAHGLEQPYADLQVTSFREEMQSGHSVRINQKLTDTLETLHAGPAPERIAVYDLRQLWMDGLTRLRMGYWAGVQSRGLSFTKANTLPGTDDEVRRQLVAISRDFGEYANFLGPQVDVDTCFVEGSRQLGYAGIPEPLTKAFQERLAKAQDTALRAEFPSEVAAAGTNAVAWRALWGNWYRSVWPRTDRKDKAALGLLSPVLWRTANREYHHGVVSTGQYPVDLYREMDVHHVEAWGDALDTVLFADSWANLGAATRRAYSRPDQPLWIESQSFFHDTLGFMQTRWWGVLANGADGVGYAANVFGLRGWSGIEPHRPNHRRQTAAAMARQVRTLGPALRLLDRDRRVAVLFSKTEADSKPGDYWYVVHCRGGNYAPFATFFALTMAGYQPDFILDEQVVQGDLDRYSALYLTYQENEMSPPVKAAVEKFVARGGKIILDAASAPRLFPSATRVDVNPLQSMNRQTSEVDWKWIDDSVAKLRSALDPLLRPLPGRVAHPRCVTYWLQRDAARYCLVINESYAPLQTTLQLTTPLGGYDLMTGQCIEPTTSLPVDLRNLNARIYAFTPAPVHSLAVSGTTKAVAGDSIALTASLLDDAGKSIDVIAPATFRITNARGETRWERWTPIGPGAVPAIWETAASEEPGTYTATITELLSGKTATFPLTLRGRAIRSPIGPPQTGAVDRRALGNLWHAKGAEWSVVLTTNQMHLAGIAEELADALRRRGLPTQIWRVPETIPIPVGYLFTPEQQRARDRVFAGKAMGARYFVHTNDAPNAPTWESRTGTAIYRNVVFFDESNEDEIRVGVREFSGNHDAVHLRGANERELRRLIREALALQPTDERIGPEAGREALARGYLLGQRTRRSASLPTCRATISQSPITWAEQIGRPIQKIEISSNDHIIVTHEGLYSVIGEFAPDGAPVSARVRECHGEECDDKPGKVSRSPNGKYSLQTDDGQERSVPLSKRFVRMCDGATGQLLWEKHGWLVYPGIFQSSVAWSGDGETLAVVRNYPNADYHGRWPELYHRCVIAIIRAADGTVMAEGAPTTWVEKMLLSADGRFAIGVPAFMADHYWLLEAGKGVTKVKASDRWLYAVELDTAGRQVFTLDIDGVLRRHQFTGEVLWSKELRSPAGPTLGILKPLDDDLLMGSTAGRLYRLSGKDGHILWQRAATDSLVDDDAQRRLQ